MLGLHYVCCNVGVCCVMLLMLRHVGVDLCVLQCCCCCCWCWGVLVLCNVFAILVLLTCVGFALCVLLLLCFVAYIRACWCCSTCVQCCFCRCCVQLLTWGHVGVVLCCNVGVAASCCWCGGVLHYVCCCWCGGCCTMCVAVSCCWHWVVLVLNYMCCTVGVTVWSCWCEGVMCCCHRVWWRVRVALRVLQCWCPVGCRWC